jgi:copper(I)-binding protein
MGFCPAADAAEFKIGDLLIERPWARASAAPTVKTGVAYLTLVNVGMEADRLVAAATPVAKKAALHTHTMVGNVMKMRPVQAIEVNPGEPSVLKPGGLHIMLMGLKDPLKEGEHFPLTLTFERAGTVEIQVRIQKPGSMEPGHGHGAAGEPVRAHVAVHVVYDAVADPWDVQAPLPQAQGGLAAAAPSGKPYGYGGEFFQPRSGAFRLDLGPVGKSASREREPRQPVSDERSLMATRWSQRRSAML